MGDIVKVEIEKNKFVLSRSYPIFELRLPKSEATEATKKWGY